MPLWMERVAHPFYRVKLMWEWETVKEVLKGIIEVLFDKRCVEYGGFYLQQLQWRAWIGKAENYSFLQKKMETWKLIEEGTRLKVKHSNFSNGNGLSGQWKTNRYCTDTIKEKSRRALITLFLFFYTVWGLLNMFDNLNIGVNSLWTHRGS